MSSHERYKDNLLARLTSLTRMAGLTGRRDRALLDNRAIRLADTAADALFVDVQANVIHTVHRSSLVRF